MENQSTNAITKLVINHIIKSGGYAWRQNTTGVFDKEKQVFRKSREKGIADVLGITKNGRFIAVEIKKNQKDTLSEYQRMFKGRVMNKNGLHFVVSDFAEFQESYNDIEKPKNIISWLLIVLKNIGKRNMKNL